MFVCKVDEFWSWLGDSHKWEHTECHKVSHIDGLLKLRELSEG